MRIQTTKRIYHICPLEVMNLWRKGNNNGEGYGPGTENMTPSEAAHHKGYIEQGDLGPEKNIVATYYEDVIVICDANGPWAVNITNALNELY